MKRLSRNMGMTALWVAVWTITVITTNGTGALAAASAADYASPPPAPASASLAPSAAPEATVTFSAGVADILRMVDAKVDPGVIKAYIENSPVAYNLSAAEIIAAKQRGVADELLASMIARGAQLREKRASAPPALPPAALVAPTPQAPAYAYDYPTVPTYPAPAYNYDYPVNPPYYYDYSYLNFAYPWSGYWPYWPIYTYYGGYYYGGHYHGGDPHPGHPGGHPGGPPSSGARGGGPSHPSQPGPGIGAGSAPSAPSAPRAPSASGGSAGRPMAAPNGGGGLRSGGAGGGGRH